MVNLERPGITLGGFCSMKHLGGFTVTSPESHLARHCFISSMRQEKYVTDLSPLFLLIVVLRTRYIRYITHLQRLLRLDEVFTQHKERDKNHIYRVWFVSTRLNARCFIQFLSVFYTCQNNSERIQEHKKSANGLFNMAATRLTQCYHRTTANVHLLSLMYFFRIHAPKKNANHTFLKSGFGWTCEYTRRVESVGPQSIFGFQ